MYVSDFGIRQMCAQQIAASVGLGEDLLGPDNPLPGYIEKQKKMMGEQLQQANFAGPQPINFSGAEEAYLLFVRHAVESVGNLIHAQTYIRLGQWSGIITLTSLEACFKQLRPDYEAFVRGLRIKPQQASELE